MARRPPEETIEAAYAKTTAARLCLAVAPGDAPAFHVALPERGAVGVGRDEQADVRVASGSLSRLHFALEIDGGAVTVRDVGSRNGTLVDGVGIGEQPVPLALGSEILAGDVRFAVVRRTDGMAARALDRDRAARGAVDAGAGDGPGDAGAGDAGAGDAGAGDAGAGDTGAGDAPGEVVGRGGAVRGAERDRDAEIPPAFRSPSLRAVHADLRRIAPRTISVLVRGETGTGKEVVARELHRLSGRRGPLVAVNAAALPETLIESELFGHERGAFSGAATAKVGLIEASDGGTLFLDEIGELPLAMQAKLLRVLEERTVRRVGANAERKVDLRVVTATHQDLGALARERRFRQDLLFRLDGATIELPPLRARRGEVLPLAALLLADLVGGVAPAIDAGAAAALERHDWPGNVRELRQVLDRALAFAEGGTIRLEHLPRAIAEGAPAVRGDTPGGLTGAVPTSGTPAGEVGDGAGRGVGELRGSVRDFERDRILAALKEAGGNRTRAAELLGLPRRTLVYKLSKMRLDEG